MHLFTISLAIILSLTHGYLPESNADRNRGLKAYQSVLYVWSGQDTTLPNANDFVAVIDFDETSPTYGSILRVVPLISDTSKGIGQTNNEPHHSSISSNGKYYVTGGLLSFLQVPKQKEIFVWKIPRNPKHGPTFVCGIDAPGACTDEFQPIGNSQFIVSMMCNEQAGSPGDMVIIDAETCTARSLLKNSIQDFNPHGYGRLNNGSMLVADYIIPLTLTATDPSKIVFRSTCRHILPDGKLEKTFNFHFPSEPGRTTGLGHGVGIMELKTIPNDPLGRGFACGTNTNLLYLIAPGMAEPLAVIDVSIVNQYIKCPSAGILSIFPDGKRMLMTFQMRFIILVDITNPALPVFLRVFDFCTDHAIYYMPIKIPGTNDDTTFPQFCAGNNNVAGTHVLIHPEGENRFIVLNYFLKFGLAQFSGTRTVHAFKLNKDLTDFIYDQRFNPNTCYGYEDCTTFHSLMASPHHAQYLRI